MFSKTIISLVLITSLLGIFPQRLISQEIKISEAHQEIQIHYLADKFSVDEGLVSKVLQCESNGKQTAVGDGGLSYGIAQFQKATWDRMSKRYLEEYNEELNYTSSFDQIKLFTYAISKCWGNEWTAYRAVKNGGTYSFYSKQLHKYFIVHCK